MEEKLQALLVALNKEPLANPYSIVEKCLNAIVLSTLGAVVTNVIAGGGSLGAMVIAYFDDDRKLLLLSRDFTVWDEAELSIQSGSGNVPIASYELTPSELFNSTANLN